MKLRTIVIAVGMLAGAAGLATGASAAHYQDNGRHGPGWYGGPGPHHGWYRYKGGWRQHCGYGPHHVWRCS